jgi:hypothetical protein
VGVGNYPPSPANKLKKSCLKRHQTSSIIVFAQFLLSNIMKILIKKLNFFSQMALNTEFIVLLLVKFRTKISGGLILILTA